MISQEWTSAEIMQKLAMLPGGFVALMAGSASNAQELVQLCRAAMTATPLTSANAFAVLRGAVGQFKANLVNAHIESRVGIDKKSVPPDVYSELYREASTIRSGVELIIAGFTTDDGPMPIVYKIAEDGVQHAGNFACIGSGAFIAESSLYYREQKGTATLNDTLYSVYEAKRLGEKAPGVGASTTLVVLRLSRRRGLSLDYIVPPGFDALKGAFQKFGPQPIKRFFSERQHFISFPRINEDIEHDRRRQTELRSSKGFGQAYTESSAETNDPVTPASEDGDESEE